MAVLAGGRFRGGCSRSDSPLDVEPASGSIGRSLPTAAAVTFPERLAFPWLNPRQWPIRPRTLRLPRTSSGPRSSRASPSSTRARTPRPRSRPAARGAWRSTPRWPSSTPGSRCPRSSGGAVLAAARPRAAAQRGGAAAGRRHGALRPPGRRAVGHADRAARRGPAQRQRQRQRRRLGRGRRRRWRPSASRARSPATTTRTTTSPRSRRTGARTPTRTTTPSSTEQPEDPNAAKRFWFEHATGAGKTVAALGFVEASRTGGVLILTHRRNLVDQFHGELKRPRLRQAHLAGAARRQGPGQRPGHRRDLPVVRAQRGQDLRRVHDRHLRRGAHRAGREDLRVDPPVERPDLRRHDRDGRADRPPRHRPLPDADLALRPRAGRAPRRHRAAALRADPARAGRAHDRQGAAAPRRGRHRVRPGDAGRAAGPAAVQPRGRRPLQDPLQRRPRRRLLRRRAPRLQRRRGVPRRRA